MTSASDLPSSSSPSELATPPPPRAYVGVGASAGGLEAIDALFSSMPEGMGLAFIVIQHLSPDYKSLMVELLSKRTVLKVERAEDGLRVLPDHVYLIPPKHNLTLSDGCLRLVEQDAARGTNLPIDIFFRSLADDQGERAVAIVLSGTGSDGTRGVRAVKEAGGAVLVQAPESARFDGMPRAAISTGIVDVVALPERMPAELMALISGPTADLLPLDQPPLAPPADALTTILAMLRERSRVDFTDYKSSTILRRIERRMSVNQLAELEDYVLFLREHPGEVVTLYREMLIGVTRFFRDREAFEELGRTWLPALFQAAGGRELRMWVPACSTGEEAYTLAILCRECNEALGLSVPVKIFATDVDRDAVQRAGLGVYPLSIVDDVPQRHLATHFVRRGEEYAVSRSIREMVVFAQHNLLAEPPFANLDVVTCRNLLIYLQPVLQRKALSLFNFSLRPNGMLFLGSSETASELSEAFEPISHRFRLYRTRGRRRPSVDDVLSLPTGAGSAHAVGAMPHRGREQRIEHERLLDRLTRTLAETYVPPCVVVNERLEVLHVMGETGAFFRLPMGRPVNDLSKMATRALAIPIATALQKSFKSGQEVRYARIQVEARGGGTMVDLCVHPMPDVQGQERLAAVFVEPVHGEVPTAPRGAVYDAAAESESRIRDLERELQFTRENLQATIEELETANEELQATNEELLASNEELQSTNEELQSVNEELHTVNAEYQSKILELTELTNDMANLFSATRIGTLFLDENLDIRKFTPEMKQVVRIMDGDVGRPISHLTHSFVDLDLTALVRQVQAGQQGVEVEGSTSGGQTYLVRVLPYEVGPQDVSGVVVTAVDLTERRRTEARLDRAEAALGHSEEHVEIAFINAGLAWWEWNLASGELSASDHRAGMLGYNPDQVGPTREDWLSLVHPDDLRVALDGVRELISGQTRQYRARYRVRKPSGEYVQVQDVGRVVEWTEVGRPLRLLGTVQLVPVPRGDGGPPPQDRERSGDPS